MVVGGCRSSLLLVTTLFTAIISFNTVRTEAKKVSNSNHRIVEFYT